MRPSFLPTLLFAFGAFGVSACSGSNTQDFCPGVTNPTVLTLENVMPAAGSSVPNDAIVHSFSIVNDIVFSDIALSYLPAHTAGDPNPALTFTYTISAETTDFAAAPVVWAKAPAHVELEAPIIYQTDDGCAYALPSPLFSYDVEPP